MKHGFRRTFAVATALMLVGCGTQQSDSPESFPNQQIRFVIPYEPGGGTDIIFRAALPHVEEELGQPIVPTNISGASATNGSREVRGAEPDGYTLLGSHETIIATHLSGVSEYSFDAFEPVALITETPIIAAVGDHTGWETADDFAEAVRENPGEIPWGVTPGSTSHFFAQTMVDSMGLPPDSLRYVNYTGTADALTAIQAGDIAGAYADHASADAQLESGIFNAIGVAHSERLEGLPDTPTFIEQGYDMTYSSARGVFAPEGTPEEIVEKISSAFETAVNNPEFENQVRELSTIPSYLPSNEYREFLDELETDLTELSEDMEF